MSAIGNPIVIGSVAKPGHTFLFVFMGLTALSLTITFSLLVAAVVIH